MATYISGVKMTKTNALNLGFRIKKELVLKYEGDYEGSYYSEVLCKNGIELRFKKNGSLESVSISTKFINKIKSTQQVESLMNIIEGK